ncbi:glycosyltransferase [Thermogymnomonas acidicola]|uniref:glycosyltransferase n=1 Tax=Thermogymnomonas acidicola TaxID=399579 RepID=UPI00139695E5|nr:glycosyltransferase [Thermogymnomonas acidicola]
MVVAAGGGADTVEVLRSLASQGISVLFERERLGKAAAYNRAIGSVRGGDAVVIVNSDVVVEPETIDLLLSSVEGGCDISFPRIVPDRSRGGFWSRVSSVLWDLQDVRIRTLMGGKGMVPSSGGEVFAIRSGHLRPIPEVINDDAYIFARVAREGGTCAT